MNKELIEKYFSLSEAISNRIIRHIHKEISEKDVGVTFSQLMVMVKIYMHKRMTVSEVAEELGVSLSNITSLVDRLSRSGHMNRRRDETDRRLVWLELTEKGKEAIEVSLEVRNRVLKQYLCKLDEEDFAKAIEINEKLLTIIEEEEKGGQS